MKKGDRVRVTSDWSTYLGKEGSVVQTSPYVTVLIDGEARPIRVGDREVTVVHAAAGEA